MYKTVIVDDEFYARKRISDLLKSRKEFEVSAECSSASDAIQVINATKPDLIFLDIELKDMSGFDVLNKISTDHLFNVVFITAYNQYAIKAFEIHAIDFLQKPFKEQRFNTTLDRVLNKLEMENFQGNLQTFLNINNKQLAKPSINTIPVKQGNKTVILKTNKIKYISASSYYSEIYFENKKLVLRESLKNLIKKLDSNYFIRIHRSTIVNLDNIKELLHSDYNELDVKMDDDNVFRVSKSYKKDFLQKVGFI